jgi:hypothetical protein
LSSPHLPAPSRFLALSSAFWARPWAVALAGFALTVLLYFPGGMSSDSVAQLAQARSGTFANWHPPLMAWVWRAIDSLLPGPAGMLILQAAAWWGGLALLATRLFAPPQAWRVLVLLGFWPPLFGMVGTIWKDVQMALAFTLAAGLMLAARRRPLWLAAALVAIAYGTAMRHNGLLAALPLAAWAAWALTAALADRRILRVLASGLVVAFTLGAPLAANRVLTAHDSHVDQLLYAYDLAGISVRAGAQLVPPAIHAKPVTLEALRAAYDPNYVDPLYPTTLAFTDDAATVRALRQAWLQAIAQHPIAYVAHRADVLSHALGLRPAVWFAYHRGVVPNDLGVPAGEATWNSPLYGLFWVLKWTPLYRPGLYLALLVAGLWVVWRQRHRRRFAGWAIAVGLSGLLYALPNGVIAIAADLRYHLWALVATGLVGATWWAERPAAIRTPTPAQPDAQPAIAG